ncbi:hypothetical protein ACRAWD_03460 [Caulobacter segnis]
MVQINRRQALAATAGAALLAKAAAANAQVAPVAQPDLGPRERRVAGLRLALRPGARLGSGQGLRLRREPAHLCQAGASAPSWSGGRRGPEGLRRQRHGSR